MFLNCQSCTHQGFEHMKIWRALMLKSEINEINFYQIVIIVTSSIVTEVPDRGFIRKPHMQN